MKKIIFMILVIFCNHAQAHVFFKSYPQYTRKGTPWNFPIPKSEYLYIRIIPSAVMEGFASFELCPLVADLKGSDKNQWLLYSEGQEMDSRNYHHDLILPQCQRPYQANSTGPQMYFDLRDLDRILSEDNRKEKTIIILSSIGSAAAALATGGIGMPVLVGFVATAGAGYAGYEITDSALNQVIHIDRDRMQWTRVEYFMGEQGLTGSDLFWPVTPAEIPTFSECYNSCQRTAHQAEQEKERKLAAEKWSEKKLMIDMPSETTNSMNPMYGKSDCELSCRMYPSQRTGMKQLWKDLYLDTIYKTGHEVYQDQYAKKGGNVDLDSEELYQRYHVEKHMDWSAWDTALARGGPDGARKVPNHYTHKANVVNQARRYYLCSYLRFNAFETYQAKGGKLSYEDWQKKSCNFSSSERCRDYYDSDVQSGKEICTTIMD